MWVISFESLATLHSRGVAWKYQQGVPEPLSPAHLNGPQGLVDSREASPRGRAGWGWGTPGAPGNR